MIKEIYEKNKHCLKESWQKIFYERFVENKSLREVGKEVGLSAQGVSDCQGRIVNKIVKFAETEEERQEILRALKYKKKIFKVKEQGNWNISETAEGFCFKTNKNIVEANIHIKEFLSDDQQKLLAEMLDNAIKTVANEDIIA